MIIELYYIQIFSTSFESERLFLNKSYVKSVMKHADSPDRAWRIPLLKELLLARSNHLLINDFDSVALSDRISAVCAT